MNFIIMAYANKTAGIPHDTEVGRASSLGVAMDKAEKYKAEKNLDFYVTELKLVYTTKTLGEVTT